MKDVKELLVSAEQLHLGPGEEINSTILKINSTILMRLEI